MIEQNSSNNNPAQIILMLLLEIGFLHGVMRKAVQGPMHRRSRCSGKIYWSKNQRLTPGAQCLIIDQTAQLYPAVEKVQALGA